MFSVAGIRARRIHVGVSIALVRRPLWVTSGRAGATWRRPVFTHKPTCSAVHDWSDKGQKQTLAAIAVLEIVLSRQACYLLWGLL